MKKTLIDYSKFSKGIKDKKLKKIVKKYVKNIAKHFKQYGYSLNVDYIIDDILLDYFSQDLHLEVLGQLCKIENVVIEETLNAKLSSTYAKKRDFVEVFYDSWYDKIVFRTDDDCITNFLEKNGFISLGVL